MLMLMSVLIKLRMMFGRMVLSVFCRLIIFCRVSMRVMFIS